MGNGLILSNICDSGLAHVGVTNLCIGITIELGAHFGTNKEELFGKEIGIFPKTQAV